MDTSSRPLSAISRLGLILAFLALSGCSTQGRIIAGSAALFGYLSRSPSNELEQIYYLGVFDPEDQLPPSLYRVRVRGQSTSFSNTYYASGWVRADLIDSLGSSIAFDDTTGVVHIDQGAEKVNLKIGRRQILFGPEGFREAPADHRLVIVMGHNPDRFFTAMDESLGIISQVRSEDRDRQLTQLLFTQLSRLQYEDLALRRLETLIPSEMPTP